jgi:hypothetical protein
MAGLTVDSIVKGADFETTINQRMDAYIESYPPKMEDSMMKFTELYFNNNDTLDHYVRDIAGSTMDIGAYKDQLDREIHQAATRERGQLIQRRQIRTVSTGRRKERRRIRG